MVKSSLKLVGIVLVLSTSVTGCGFLRAHWGEKAPPRKTVVLESQSLPELTEIFNDDPAIAEKTLSQYRASILDSFDQIQGRDQNRLSLQEIESLARSGLAKLSNHQELNLKRIRSVMKLLGFKDGISRAEIISLLDWLKENRVKSKTFYELLIKNHSELELNSDTLIQLVQFSGSLISLGGDSSLNKAQVAELIRPWIPEEFAHASKGLDSAVDLFVSAFGSLCGDRIESNLWNAKKNGECLLSLVNHFRETAPVFDMIFNRLNPIAERKALSSANAIFVSKVQSWIDGHHHPTFQTSKIARLAEQLEIPSPYQFFQLTQWLPKLNPASTTESFSPTFFIDIAKVVQNWISLFLKVTLENEVKSCSFVDWKLCDFKGNYETADRLFNDEYATLLRTSNLGFINKITLYDSVSQYLLGAFDTDKDGILKDDIKDLITIVIRMLDSMDFAKNVINRIQEKPVDPVTNESSIKNLYRQGLAEVAALVADLIPDRDGNKRKLLKKVTSIVYDAERRQSYTLDQLGITTFIYVFDLLSNLRTKYLENYDFEAVQEGNATLIKRRKIVELLPQMLHDHFPRIYNECLDWGFERTCGVIYTEVLASAPYGSELLEDSDIDLLNLTSILLESMMNRCDRNLDDQLSTNILDGYDEKHCVLTISTTLANRLMNAKILQNDRSTKTLIKVMKWLPPVRWAAKVALEKGTLMGLGIRAVPGISLASGPAKLGGVMSLTAELMDPEKVDAIEKGIMGHHEDAGDELIYLNQLTDHYLPSKDWAPRTSAAARLLYGPSGLRP